MNWLDIVLVVILIGSVASGFQRGFVKIAIGFAALIAALVLASWFYAMAGAWFSPWMHSRVVANFMGFWIVFVLVIAVGGLLGLVITKALHLAGLGFADRAGGAVLGLVQGAVFGAILVMALLAFPRRPPQAVVESRFAPYLAGSAAMISEIAPYELRKGVRDAYDSLLRMWRELPKHKDRDLEREKERGRELSAQEM